MGRYEAAISEYQTVIALNRNHVNALAASSTCKLFTGSIQEAIPLVEQAIRLSPRDPDIAVWCYQIGRVHLLQSRTDEAILWLERARSTSPALPFVHIWLASAYALKGMTEHAATELSEARGLSADDRFTSIARLRALGHGGLPRVRTLFEATYFAGLRKAGLPEE
jgi:tetratricopeptide (TPR) repeat protein